MLIIVHRLPCFVRRVLIAIRLYHYISNDAINLFLFIRIAECQDTIKRSDNIVERVKPAPPAAPAVTRESSKNVNNIKVFERKSRSDVLRTYPFADNSSSVADAFQSKSSNVISVMGRPARKRFACSIFDEMRIGASGMLIRSIPEALKLLGLPVPLKLQNIIIKSAEIMATELLTPKVTPGVGRPLETTITLDQWLTLVDKYILNEAYLVNSNEVPANVDDDYDELDERYVSQLLFPTNHQVYNIYDGNYNHNRNITDENTSPSYNNRAKYDVPTSPPRSSPPPRTIRPKVRDTKTSHLRKVQSRIAADVTRDKNRWRMIKVGQTNAALEAIAKHRVDEILDQNSSNHNPGRLRDVSSGSAAMAIADEFLRSNVGKTVITSSNIPNDEEIVSDEYGMHVTSAVEYPGISGGNSKPTRNVNNENVTEGKWTVSKNGWVADFKSNSKN